MSDDLTKLSPAALVRMVNSTRLGPALTERKLYRQRMAAGSRIGDKTSVHLLRYARWLAGEIGRLTVPPGDGGMAKKNKPATQYEDHRRQAAARQAQIAAEGQEIGPPPPVENPSRRESCRLDFARFCVTYFPAIFYLAWSKDHLSAIAKIERAVLKGELFALAMPRGSGKSALCIVAVLWAVLYGHHRFVCLIAATENRARKLLQKIFNILERSDLLLADFPEVCFPIRSLERTSQRARKQRSNGEYTSMVWTVGEIVLPTIRLPDGKLSPSSGAILTACGLTGGEILGQVKDMPDGSLLRPSLALLDDPQTRASAKSPTQIQDRVELLQGGVLGMAGPDRKIAGLMTCTVIRSGDMADQMLDPQKNPEWQGERTKMVYAWPTATKLWDEYFAVRAEGLRGGDGGRLGNDFYRKNRLAMDQGSEVAWPERFPSDCLSAIQHAMNLRFRDEAMFASEYQNEPSAAAQDSEFLSADQIAMKVSGRTAGAIPGTFQRLTAAMDVHDRLIYWMVCGWSDDFTGSVVAYGTFPDQQRTYFAMRNATRTLARVFQKKAGESGRSPGREGAIYAGLKAVCDDLLNRQWRRDDGATLKIDMALIDERWETKTVHRFISEQPLGYVYPSAGLPLKVTSPPFHSRANKPGERSAEHCRMTPIVGKARGRHLVIDTNYWKTQVHRFLATPSGDRASLAIYGRRRADGQAASITEHRLLAEHLTAETHTLVVGPYGPVDVWEEHGADNHWFDCLVGCAVQAAWLGCSTLRDESGRSVAARPVATRKVKRPWRRS